MSSADKAGRLIKLPQPAGTDFTSAEYGSLRSSWHWLVHQKCTTRFEGLPFSQQSGQIASRDHRLIIESQSADPEPCGRLFRQSDRRCCGYAGLLETMRAPFSTWYNRAVLPAPVLGCWHVIGTATAATHQTARSRNSLLILYGWGKWRIPLSRIPKSSHRRTQREQRVNGLRTKRSRTTHSSALPVRPSLCWLGLLLFKINFGFRLSQCRPQGFVSPAGDCGPHRFNHPSLICCTPAMMVFTLVRAFAGSAWIGASRDQSCCPLVSSISKNHSSARLSRYICLASVGAAT